MDVFKIHKEVMEDYRSYMQLSATASDQDCHYIFGLRPRLETDSAIAITWTAVLRNTSTSVGSFPNGNTGSVVKWLAPTFTCDVTIQATASNTASAKAVDGNATDDIWVQVIGLDLDINGTSDDNEYNPGQYLPLNDDDDNDNDIKDHDESDVQSENDMVSLHITSLLPSNETGIIKLEALSGADKIKVWEQSSKCTEITLPIQWNYPVDTIPTVYYIEGIKKSTNKRDVELKLSFIGQNITVTDKVIVTVVNVDFQEDIGQIYGYDSYTNPYFPYKSVKIGSSDTVDAYCSIPDSVFFTTVDQSIASVSPPVASSNTQKVTFNGIASGFTQCWAELFDPIQYDLIAASIGVYSFNIDNYSVAFRVVHEDNQYMSTTPYTAAQLENFLNNSIYHQSVVNWSVVQLPDMSINFDLNGDGQLNFTNTAWAPEPQEIINQCAPVNGGYDKIILIVNKPDKGWNGVTYFGSRHLFVFPDKTPDPPKTTAHELGHAAFQLPDLNSPSSDTDNIMWFEFSNTKWRLRKDDWLQIQSFQ